MLRREVDEGRAYFEEGVAHGVCDRAVVSSFLLVGRCGVAVCVHKHETKVSYMFPEDASTDEAAAAYEVGKEQAELANLAARGRSK